MGRLNQVWVTEGDTLLAIEHNCFKVHYARLSPFIRALPIEDIDFHGRKLVRLPRGGIATHVDVEALLRAEYQFSQPPLAEAPFVQAARVLRAATQFEFPQFRQAALARLMVLYPRRPAPFACANWQYVHEAAQLAIDCRANELLPPLLYAIMTTSDLDIDGDDPAHTNDTSPGTPTASPTDADTDADETRGRTLPASTTRRCVLLLQHTTEHFAPVLFTVPTAAHMTCTGAFAEHWMARVVQPALTHGGIYRPLETLHVVQGVDWHALGICESCYAAKRAEWRAAADDVWCKIERWAVG